MVALILLFFVDVTANELGFVRKIMTSSTVANIPFYVGFEGIIFL